MADDILIVDDEADIRELVSGILQDEGFITRSARDSDDALAHVASRRPNLVFLDIWLQGSRLDGLQLLDAMKGQHPELPIVMISGHGNIETAVAAIKQGAYDSSRSRSRPTGWCSSPSAHWRRRASSARSRRSSSSRLQRWSANHRR